MLGPNVVVVEALGFFLGELKHLACPFGEFIESFCHEFVSDQ